ncbi:MAG: hypothetical protein GC139_07300 [Sideroxydans sp.]|nr:hypothetical protein [Sideroxydans sp.]
MALQQPIRLTFELLSDEDDARFSIHSRKEIQFILKSIARQNSQVALYYGNRETFILTTLLDVNQHGLWLEASQNQKQNERIAQSRKFYFVSAHQHVKAQFTSDHLEIDEFDDTEAFFMPLPRDFLRIQRRDHFRLPTPIANPLKCIVPVKPLPTDDTQAYPILDLSSGGVALTCAEDDPYLEEGRIYPDCRILLADNTSISVTLQVRNMFMITKPSGVTTKRVGCKFVDLDGKVEILLQRYITQLEQSLIKSST